MGPLANCWKYVLKFTGEIDPPRIDTADGLTFSLLEVGEDELYDIAKDAWAQKIAWEVQKRKDMQGQGIDEKLLRSSSTRTPGYKKHCINLLRDGSFVDNSKHKKYDLGKTGQCKLCAGEDSLEHRCKHCPHMAEVRKKHGPILEKWDQMLMAMRHHLIPSRNPWLSDFRKMLHDGGAEAGVGMPLQGRHH